MKLTRTLIAALALAAVGGSAFAADKPAKPATDHAQCSKEKCCKEDACKDKDGKEKCCPDKKSAAKKG